MFAPYIMTQNTRQHPLADFRNFLYLAWKHLNLPDPTPVQYDIADYLQNAPKNRCVIEAFRGIGKSWITSAFVCWLLLWNPQLNILVVSASKGRADNFSTFTLGLINSMPELAHLKPRPDQRTSKVAFDVGPARTDHAPSVTSKGITGQLTGSRADIIIADDVEVPNNSATQGMRHKLSEAIKEFEAILKPDPHTRVIFLGTPQSMESIYNDLETERDHDVRIWPAEYPDQDHMAQYGTKLAPRLRKELEKDPSLVGKPTEPSRFNAEVLLQRRASYGNSGYELQFMLNTELSDADRYPLKLRDLVVTDLDAEKAYEKYVWASSPDLAWSDLPCVGMSGDGYFRPMDTAGSLTEYGKTILAIDPSGRGKDETSYVILKYLNSQIFLLDAGGLREGYSPSALNKLAYKAQQWKTNLILIESNFGDGMFTSLLQPVLTEQGYPCKIEEVRNTTMKERRIIDTLEPVMNQHRLIVNKRVVEDDFRKVDREGLGAEAAHYRLFHQMSHITPDKGALAHDDRLDCLAMGVAHFVKRMNLSRDQQMHRRRQQAAEDEIQAFLKAAGRKRRKTKRWVSLR